MNSEITEALCLNETIEVSCSELLSISGLSADELQELVDSGVLVPTAPQQPWTFSGNCISSVRAASRLRDDFELDRNALALTLLMLERIRQLESELREFRS